MSVYDLMFVAGVAVFVAGVALIYVPAAVMLAGIGIAGLAGLGYLGGEKTR